MKKLKIIEHISLDGVIQNSADGVIQNSADGGDFLYSDWTAPYRPRWPGRSPRRAWRAL